MTSWGNWFSLEFKNLTTMQQKVNADLKPKLYLINIGN
jgi:hypothetical protein